jgi:hypothetical protein
MWTLVFAQMDILADTLTTKKISANSFQTSKIMKPVTRTANKQSCLSSKLTFLAPSFNKNALITFLTKLSVQALQRVPPKHF